MPWTAALSLPQVSNHLSTYCVPGAVVDSGNRAGSKGACWPGQKRDWQTHKRASGKVGVRRKLNSGYDERDCRWENRGLVMRVGFPEEVTFKLRGRRRPLYKDSETLQAVGIVSATTLRQEWAWGYWGRKMGAVWAELSERAEGRDGVRPQSSLTCGETSPEWMGAHRCLWAEEWLCPIFSL